MGNSFVKFEANGVSEIDAPARISELDAAVP